MSAGARAGAGDGPPFSVRGGRETPEARALPVVAAVLRDGEGRILLAQRLPGGSHGGLWEFPGGKVEDGEGEREALARELVEELGIRVTVGELVLAVDHAYPHLRICLAAYACTLVAGTPQPIHCQAYAWVPPRELTSYPMPAADVPIARLLAAQDPDG